MNIDQFEKKAEDLQDGNIDVPDGGVPDGVSAGVPGGVTGGVTGGMPDGVPDGRMPVNIQLAISEKEPNQPQYDDEINLINNPI